MKTICYLILAHNNLDYVAKLIKSLACKNVGFILHIDAKCTENTSPLKSMTQEYKIIFLENRKDITWGDRSMVDIVNDMCRIGLCLKEKYDYFILLSGQDMPLKSGEYIKSYILNNGAKNFIEASPMLTDECVWQEQGRRRLKCYAIRLSNRDIATIEPKKFNTGNLKQIVKTVLRGDSSSVKAMLRILFLAEKRNGFRMKSYGGEFWWRLNRESLEKIINYYDSHPELEKELEYTAHPDEIIYNTLVYNLCGNIENSLHTFINWKNSKSPDWLSLRDIELIIKLIEDPDMLFCRKVKDVKILDLVIAKTISN